MSPADATGGRNTPIEVQDSSSYSIPTSGGDTSNVGSWGYESMNDPLNQPPTPVEVTPVEVQTNVTKDYDQSMNVLTAETPQDITIMNTTNTGINMQNDVTKNSIINESGLFPGEERKPWEDTWDNLTSGSGSAPPSSSTTMQVPYNVPGGGLQTADVQTWQEDGKYYTEYLSLIHI